MHSLCYSLSQSLRSGITLNTPEKQLYCSPTLTQQLVRSAALRYAVSWSFLSSCHSSMQEYQSENGLGKQQQQALMSFPIGVPEK